MKFNIYQKILSGIFFVLLIHFCILSAPFRIINNGTEIIYDSIFSNKIGLDYSRYILISMVLIILFIITILITGNLNSEQNNNKSHKFLTSLLISIFTIACIWTLYNFINNKTQKDINEIQAKRNENNELANARVDVLIPDSIVQRGQVYQEEWTKKEFQKIDKQNEIYKKSVQDDEIRIASYKDRIYNLGKLINVILISSALISFSISYYFIKKMFKK